MGKALHRARIAAVVVALACTVACCSLGGCGSSSDEATSGPSYSEPTSIETSGFDASAAEGQNDALIDVSSSSKGYVGASATSASKLKFQVSSGEMSYSYDLPSDGTPIVCPINMGDGAYTFRVMRNVEKDSYVEICSVSSQVTLDSEFEPYLRPNVFCDYDEDSACVAKARDLASDATNEGDVLSSVCDYITHNVTYDRGKAASLSSVTGYVPDPDATLASGTGICFDYSSLGAAMLRSLGIPCKIMTGYVSPDDIYHAWIMVYIDGKWTMVGFDVESNTWTRVDLTFAASDGNNGYVGDGSEYTDRYTY
ncbi:MAG: transglutaminase-like domain-containing protein [Atopobiaceae bacterium]|nr:transglutaminase-like domain-containing protein [Atopobiaceae bacterium]MCI2174083.1 transglutaminase-like domain-containing protein [Atopobiaceae bacterium]MCI2207827.1 transglutaminase-like domain-containing protein [Atopobiaceae bacterium]